MKEFTPQDGAAPRSRFSSRVLWLRTGMYGILLTAVLAGGILSGNLHWVAARQSGAGEQNKVAARVNGEPIYESEVTRGMPKDIFAEDIADMRKLRLDALISRKILRQYVAQQKVNVTESEVDNAVAQLRKNPPSLGCPCCRYGSLDAYLKDNVLTLEDLRADIKNQYALQKYIMALWEKTYPTPQSRAALVTAQRRLVQSEFTNAWQIFFNTFQVKDAPPAQVSAQARAKAEAAWKRLRKGEPFAQVAREVSEDQMSKNNGGALGFIIKEAYGKEFANELGKLKPGEISKPFASIYGYHIIKWEPIKNDELLDISKADFSSRKTGEIMDRLDKKAQIVRY